MSELSETIEIAALDKEMAEEKVRSKDVLLNNNDIFIFIHVAYSFNSTVHTHIFSSICK